jgi:hypothetical protein
MKTTLDIVDAINTRLQAVSSLSTLSGKIYKYQRPVDSDLEDLVINCLPITNEQLQRAVANVNCYVPDTVVTVNGKENRVPNLTRLKAIAAIVMPALTDWISGSFTCDVQQQLLVPDSESNFHYLNIRLQFYVSNI